MLDNLYCLKKLKIDFSADIMPGIVLSSKMLGYWAHLGGMIFSALFIKRSLCP